MEIATVIAVACAFGAGGLAWGYRGQRDQEREQVVYLRAQLRESRSPTPDTNVKALNPPAQNRGGL